ncbi:uncharacterized protein LOC131304747 isoform X2 [Rhododendron vialii]|uniref:uncharacterized protein LOC131304747 isoform X2 n=1 Tax=Rhododendron vialii TaxID=182163 RepID=UPI00265E75D2|nr:uncharacterized protein LOC131304747 isoform X2 [Rhododendron vialii]
MESEIDRNKLLYICSIIGEGKTRIKNCWPNVCLGHNSTVLPIPALSLYRKLSDKLVGIVYPYVQITIHEHTRGRHNEVYAAIESYLGAKSTVQARRLKADMVKNSKSFVLSLDKSEWRSQMSSKVSWKKVILECGQLHVCEFNLLHIEELEDRCILENKCHSTLCRREYIVPKVVGENLMKH